MQPKSLIFLSPIRFFPSSLQPSKSHMNGDSLIAPFPAPEGKSSDVGLDIVSPADSVFSQADSASSDECRSGPELTPSPDRTPDTRKTTSHHPGEHMTLATNQGGLEGRRFL